MSLPVPVDLFPQFLLISEGLFRYDGILILLAVGSRLHMGRIYKNYRLVYQTRLHALFQYLPEDPLKQVGILEVSHVVLSESAEMLHRIMQPQAKKPAVGIVHLNLLDRLAHAPDPKHILYSRQLNQDNRIETGASVVFAVAVRHHLINEAPVDGVLQLTYKVICRHQLVKTRELNLILILASVPCHHVPLPSTMSAV